jgi:hypothetical protein
LRRSKIYGNRSLAGAAKTNEGSPLARFHFVEDYERAAIQVSVFLGCFAIAYFLAIPTQRLFRIQLDPAGRLSQLEGLRAIAALAVVACHVNQNTLAFFEYTELPDAGNHIGVLAVQMFFALTAYLFTARAVKGTLDPAIFYVSRLRRTLPLYLSSQRLRCSLASATSPEPSLQFLAFLNS